MKHRSLRHSGKRILLTLGLTVVLPAGALIVFNILHLKSIQRDKVLEAAIQRDFYQMLAISEKKMNERAHSLLAQAEARFPCPEEDPGEGLDKVLEKYPHIAHGFLFDPQKGLTLRSQPDRLSDKWFWKEREKLEEVLKHFLPLEAKEMVYRMRQAKGRQRYMFWGNPAPRKDGMRYQVISMFVPSDTPSDRVALGGMVLDADYLEQTFFPAVLNELVSDHAPNDRRKQLGLLLRGSKEMKVVAESSSWDGGKPEVERNLDEMFRGLTLGIKYRGTTLAAIGERWLRNSFVILGCLSLMLAGGILLTHRNVAKEVELARLKSDFVSNVSHELRTPLSLIRLYAETLELGRLTNPARRDEYYTIIRKESERLTALINNILDFSRIEAGRKEYDFRETDLAELVRNTLDSYRYQIEQQGFVFEQKIAENLPKVHVDREAMARSVLNLVNNAIKYSPREKYLAVSVYRSNGSVKLEVVDHGIGIPRSEQSKIFQEFYRVGDPLVHNTKGTGLGLSLVRHIARAHGGEVAVESQPGKGSKFIISLPATAHHAEASRQRTIGPVAGANSGDVAPNRSDAPVPGGSESVRT